MILRIIRLKTFLLLIFLTLSSIVFSQGKTDDRKLLLGKWVFEDVIPSENVDSVQMELINSYLKPGLEIIMRQESMTFRNNTSSEKGEYVLNGHFLYFNINGNSIGYEWGIMDNKLYLEGSLDTTDKEGKDITLVAIFVYKRQ